MKTSEDGQISLTDPDSRSMATSGRGTGIEGYNVQTAVDAKHHMIGRLASMARVEAVCLCTEAMDMRAGTETSLARVVCGPKKSIPACWRNGGSRRRRR